MKIGPDPVDKLKVIVRDLTKVGPNKKGMLLDPLRIRTTAIDISEIFFFKLGFFMFNSTTLEIIRHTLPQWADHQ